MKLILRHNVKIITLYIINIFVYVAGSQRGLKKLRVGRNGQLSDTEACVPSWTECQQQQSPVTLRGQVEVEADRGILRDICEYWRTNSSGRYVDLNVD